ncbi:hypothetical protein EP331_11365 [bacterium]|nr:MAG: hypothetical protein EP331_11365 [bacterium]
MQRSSLFLSSGLIVLAIVSRFLPHPPNFAPIMSVALFGGVYLSDKRLAMAIPFVIMFLSDLFLGFHNTLFFVYGSFALMVGAGFWLRNHVSVMNVLFTAIGGSILFFLISNLGVWLTSGGFYPMNAAGLMECYTAAIPFFHNSLLGDVVYTSVLFGAYEFAKRRLPQAA